MNITFTVPDNYRTTSAGVLYSGPDLIKAINIVRNQNFPNTIHIWTDGRCVGSLSLATIHPEFELVVSESK